jgi:pimeloyl-ACP methyl ester carboxylesterase
MHPGAIRSMVLLSGSFKHANRTSELDTVYERNLEMMLRAIAREPSLAERLRVLFVPSGVASVATRADIGQGALEAVNLLSPDIEHQVLQPFRDATALTIYAHQHLDFWSHDETATGSEVCVPILGIAGAHDEIVSPVGFREALNHFPLARYLEIAGTAHYCFYERFDLVADVIEDFLPQR